MDKLPMEAFELLGELFGFEVRNYHWRKTWYLNYNFGRMPIVTFIERLDENET